MPFFEPVAPPPPETPRETERVWMPPRWDRPSEGTLPTVVGVSQLIGRTDNVALALDHLRVYPNGFQLVFLGVASPRLPPELHMGGFASFSVIAAGTVAPSDPEKTPPPPPPPPPLRPPYRRGMMEMAPRIGIRFSNGQSAGGGAGSVFDVAKDDEGVPIEPFIGGGGFSGGGGHFRFERWVFPIPTPGPLEVFAEWSVAGIEETRIVISGDEVRAAAERATILWS